MRFLKFPILFLDSNFARGGEFIGKPEELISNFAQIYNFIEFYKTSVMIKYNPVELPIIHLQDIRYSPLILPWLFIRIKELADGHSLSSFAQRKGIKEISRVFDHCKRSDPLRRAVTSVYSCDTCARVSRCSLLAMSMAYPLACYWHRQVRPENSWMLVLRRRIWKAVATIPATSSVIIIFKYFYYNTSIKYEHYESSYFISEICFTH